MFLTLLCLTEIASLSRFYIFIVFTCILVISKKFTLFIIHNIFNYFMIFLLGSASIKNSPQIYFLNCILISNEIVKLLNGRIEWSQISF